MTIAPKIKLDAAPKLPQEAHEGILALFKARYGDEAQDLPPHWNDTLAGLLAHRSVRAYLPTPLPVGALKLIVVAAQSAATSSNLQVWSVVTVEDEDRKSRLAALAGGQKHIAQAPLFLLFLADLSRLERIAEARGLRAEAHDYLESLLVAVIDAALAAQNAVVAAESLGLGSVYIGAIRNKPAEVAAELGLPPNVLAVFGLCLGYADESTASGVKPRLPQNLVLHKERYNPEIQAEALAAYDEAMRRFQKSQGIAEIGWTQQALDRVASAASLKGRDRLSDALRKLGFGLR
jgi:nitroreductase